MSPLALCSVKTSKLVLQFYWIISEKEATVRRTGLPLLQRGPNIYLIIKVREREKGEAELCTTFLTFFYELWVCVLTLLVPVPSSRKRKEGRFVYYFLKTTVYAKTLQKRGVK